MSYTDQNKSKSILSSLKKLIFEDEKPSLNQTREISRTPEAIEPTIVDSASTSISHQKDSLIPSITSINDTIDIKEMKIKVLNIMESLNQPGIDFFEVWNAAAAMGKVDNNSLKAAYTSFKIIDKSLTKEKLITSINHYIDALKDTITKESESKKIEIETTKLNRQNEISSLNTEIESLTKRLTELQTDLTNKQKSLNQINQKYDPKIKEIETKINIGNEAVNETIEDIKSALVIIEKFNN